MPTRGIYNKTTKRQLAKDFELAADTLSRALGIMFRRRLGRPLVFIFPSSSSTSRTAIHSFFVFFPFLAVFLNERKKVVELAVVRPWTFLYEPKRPARYLIECGTELKRHISVGDEIEL